MSRIAFLVACLVSLAASQTSTPAPISTTTRNPILEQACKDLVPFHPGSPGPQNTTAPVAITVERTSVRNGEIVNVFIDNIGDSVFNGFMVQARPAYNYREYRVLGTWGNPPGETYNLGDDCQAANDTAFNDKPDRYPNGVILPWRAPSEGSGEVIFFASITKNFTVFWIDLFSNHTVKYGF